MNTINKITSWGDSHHFAWLDIFRAALGAFLVYKGIQFGRDPHEIRALANAGDSSLFSFFYVQIIPMIHIAGGLMIFFGILTRWAAAFQIPILIAAVVLSIGSPHPMEIYPQVILSLVVLTLLIIFLICGSGPYSADAYFKKNEDRS
ncbi:MAG: DoxX family protein [Bacteroidota bacterium]|jgi:uncharacterized membrane protein YphA (DoxX/SURF4 family)|nr:DoxX family protein [Bacteroidota bacterium]